MSNLEKLKSEYEELCNEFDSVSNYMHSIGRKLREKKKEIEELESRTWFKYNGKIYRVFYEELKRPHRSLLFEDRRNGNLIIKIDSRLTSKEKQEELHIMLRRKKCLKYFGGVN